jgi:predicted RNase H-like HicB family nuclease
MRYAIVVEKAEVNYAAYVPDLPGCVAMGATLMETEARLREAIELHLGGMREAGLAIPEPSSIVDSVETSTAHVGRLVEHCHSRPPCWQISLSLSGLRRAVRRLLERSTLFSA